MPKDFVPIKLRKLLFCLPAAAVMFACGCAPQVRAARTVAVSIADSLFFTPSVAAARVEAGSDFTVTLDMLHGYAFVGCDYGDYTAEELPGGDVRLTLRSVTAPVRVVVTSEEVYRESQHTVTQCSVVYDYNGGVYNGASRHSESYTLTEHLRPNTWTARGLQREGYTLLGWNTAADGSGEHIGLGSRVTVEDGGEVTLYAEWVQWLPEGDLLYDVMPEGTVTLTGYRGDGDGDMFVLPAYIDGNAVTRVAASFTTNIPCGSISSPVLVLPDTLVTVENGAFGHSAFRELYFFDNLENINESAFGYNIVTYHVNAAEPPAFQAVNNSSYYADLVDRVIVNKDKPKIVLFAGCSFAYGVNSNMVDNSFDGRYVVCNLGCNGDINGAFQMEILLEYLGEGDVLVHSPEEMSAPQLMSSFYLDGRMFIMVEGNYDLISLVDFSQNDLFFRAYNHFRVVRENEDECTYADGRTESFNEYGDFVYPRPYDESDEVERDVSYSDDMYNFAPEMLTEEGIAKLAGYYAAAEAKGAKVCITYAPVNSSAQTGIDVYEAGRQFDEKFKSLLAPYGYTVISDYRDYIYPGRYFYDSDYHLNDYGAIVRSVGLIEDLRAAGV